MEYTPAQAQAIAGRGPRICVDAGAGSGKTRVLVDRIAALLEARDAGLDEIAAITFTEKAAAEMRERLRAAFRAKVPDDDPETADRWRELERRADNARVGTIHSFCAGLLRENALWLGLDPDFAVLADHDAVLLRRDCVKRCLHRLLEAGDAGCVRLASELKPEEIERLIGALLANRDTVEQCLEGLPRDCQALQSHWRELVERARADHLDALRHEPRLRRAVSRLRRFDGACDNPKDGREDLRLRMIAGFERILDGASPTEVTAILEDLSNSGRGAKKNWCDEESWDAISKLETKIKSDIKDKFLPNDTADPEIEANAAQQTLDVLSLYEAARDAFDSEKAALNGMDFDDLIGRVRTALRKNADVRERSARSIKFLLIDEFQDTDRGQLEIADLLCGEEGGPSLFVVGDVKQSIYYFRGAEVGVFNEVRHSAAQLITLDSNFRSQPGVLGFVNEFFTRSQLLSAVEEYTPLLAHRPAGDAPCVEFLLSQPETDDKRGADQRRQDEATLIARRIAMACDGPEALQLPDGGGGLRPARPGDFALLFRRMGDIETYERALRDMRLPYTLVAGSGFYKRQEIIDILNLLKVLLDPWDDTALVGFLRSPMAGVADTSLYHLTRGMPLSTAFASARTLEDKAEAHLLDKARGLITELRAALSEPIPDLLRRALDLTAYEAVLLAGPHGIRKTANIRKLLQLANAFARSGQQSLRGYMEYVEALRSEALREGEAGLQPDGAGGVTLMTIHKSKGLEFPVVFLPDLGARIQGGRSANYLTHRDLGCCVKVRAADGELATPSLGTAITRRTSAEEAAERARLLYVAMTRARDHLFLCGGADFESSSWLDDFDAVFEIGERSDGQSLRGKGWTATIRCESLAQKKPKADTPPEDATPVATLLERAHPIAETPPHNGTYAISTVLDLMMDAADQEDERGDAPHAPGAQFAMARGSLVHQLFELWRFDSAPPDIPALILDSEFDFPDPAALAEDLRSIAANFSASPLGQRLAKGRRVRRELPFHFDLGGPLLSGYIDALLDDGTIIDYKTGRFHANQHTRYEWQLLLYAAALRDLTGATPKEGLLYYVDANEVRAVPFSDAQINEALARARQAISVHSTRLTS